jgi:PPOX class probable F420-dependent enzyme
MDELSRARYIALTTYKRDGSAKTTPVWVTGSEGTYAFTTGADAWKARRLRRNPNVEVRACDLRGRSTAEATRFVGTGEVLDTPDAVAGVEAALAGKYGVQFRAIKLVEGIKGRLGRATGPGAVAIRLSLHEA